MAVFGQLIFVAVLLFLGLVCLLAPERVRDAYADAAKTEALKQFVNSAEWLVLARFVGVLAVAGGLCLLVVTLGIFRG